MDKSATNYEAGGLIPVEKGTLIKDGSCKGVISAFYLNKPNFFFENLGFFYAIYKKMKKDNNWHDNELRKLKQDKKEALGKKVDEQGTASDVRNRKRIKEEFKKERRRIKRVEKRNWEDDLSDELDKYYNDRY